MNWHHRYRRSQLIVAISVSIAWTSASSGHAQSDTAAEAQQSAIEIYPATQPDPLLRYRLWPAPQDRRDENPAPRVSRAVILTLQATDERQKEFAELFESTRELSIDKLPIEKMRSVLDQYQPALGELQRAVNLMRIEYPLQLDELSSTEMIQTLLPELGEMRQLARILTMRARLAVAEKRWDDAVADCRTCLRLADVAGHSTEFLVGRLVGLAITGMTFEVLIEASQQPGCPSLYWALATLPENRLFEIRDSIEFESVLMSKIFPTSDLPDQPIGEDAARQRIRELATTADEVMSFSDPRSDQSTMAQLLSGLYVITLAEPSRELLNETDTWRGRADRLSAPEAVLRATHLKFARIRDRWVAWSMLPPQLWAEYDKERRAAFGVGSPSLDIAETLAATLMPAVDAAMNAGRRTHQQRNFLITIEALRLYAAEKGELPASLADLRPVPAWPDAIAMQPFAYQRHSPHAATLTHAPRFPNDEQTSHRIELKATK